MTDDTRRDGTPTPLANLVTASDDLARRDAPLTLPSSKVTEGELKNIERALLNPPKKVDWPVSVIGLLSSGFFAAKTLADTGGEPKGVDLFAVIAAGVLFGGVLLDIIRRAKTIDPHHDAAVEDVRKLMGRPTKPGA